METVKVAFDWENPSIEGNFSHTQSEWGKVEKKLPRVMISYDVKFKKA